MSKVHHVSAFGLASWDRLLMVDEYPPAGSYAVIREIVEQSGGTTSNMVVALARLGIGTSLAAFVGDDADGQRIVDELCHEGCDVEHVHAREGEPTDRAIIIVSGEQAEIDRTIFWEQGARLRHGDYLPIESFFAHDLVLVDTDDYRLRRMIVDLPSHVSPRTKLLGTMTYLVEFAQQDALDIALRHDYLVGNEREFLYISGESTLDVAIRRFQNEMIFSQTRFAAISRGASGCIIIDRTRSVEIPAYAVDVHDPTGAGDAFAAGIVFGILNTMELTELGRFANAMGALATRDIGARSALPDRSTVEDFLQSAIHLRRVL